jgi:hypothetical protein
MISQNKPTRMIGKAAKLAKTCAAILTFLVIQRVPKSIILMEEQPDYLGSVLAGNVTVFPN